jgi:hypothetical protein
MPISFVAIRRSAMVASGDGRGGARNEGILERGAFSVPALPEAFGQVLPCQN